MSHVAMVTLIDYANSVLDDDALPSDFLGAVRILVDVQWDEFIARAYQTMPAGRQLYIDASILKVLVRASVPGLQEDAARECISILDRAIIIAGAAVDAARRDYVVHDVIKRLQSAIPWQPPTSAALVAGPASLPPLSTSRNGISTLTSLPSIFAPQHSWCHAPFLLRHYADDWPAVHRWASLSYLFFVAGPGRTVPVEVGDDYRSDDWSQTLTNWEDFLSYLASTDTPQQRPMYLAQHSLFTQFPKLREDILLPDIVYASLDSPEFPAYRPPHDVIVNAWLGPKGTISPAHTDPFFNCYVQVVGRKTVWLAPPNVAAAMYPYQSNLTGADGSHHHPAVNAMSPLMSNTSRVDVFVTASHERNVSQSVFPLFWANVPEKASCVTLNAGDVLFFPPGWWHAMRSEDVSFSVSMWF